MSRPLPPEAHLGDAELDEWARLPVWTIAEAVVICAGLNPNVVRPDSIFFRSNALPPEVHRSLNLAKRAVLAGELPQHCPPATFIEWALTHGIEIDKRLIGAPKYGEINARREELQAVVAKLKAELEAVKKARSKPETDPRRVKGWKKLVALMAKDRYRFDPNAKRSDLAPRIRKALQVYGLDMDEEVILECLREAAALLPKQMT